MPVIKNAKRALRVSARKTIDNKKTRAQLEVALRTAKKSKNLKTVSKAYSLLDRAAKKHIIHKNRAGRLKSALSRLLSA